MEVTFQFDTNAEKEIFRNLRKLDNDLQAKFLIQAARTSLNRLGKLAKENVKTDTGALQRSIQTDIKIYNSGAVMYGVVGINSKTKGKTAEGELRRPIKYAHIVEFYKPFMRPAYEAYKDKIQPTFEKLIENKVKKALRS